LFGVAEFLVTIKGMNVKRGRPRMSPWEKRPWIVSLRLRVGEYRQVQKLALADGRKVADWIRETVLRVAGVDSVDASSPKSAGRCGDAGTAPGPP
jgi:hypothetical protein